MYYGDEVTIERSSIIVSRKAVQSIGIVDRSRCWGIWLEDVRQSDDWVTPRVPHLLLSAFHPSSWSILFRLTVKIRDVPGAALKLAEILDGQRFNILFNESVPTGFTHLTWNIIGEALSLRDTVSPMLEKVRAQVKGARDVSNDGGYLDYVSTKFSPVMLEYARQLRSHIIAVNRAELDADTSSSPGRGFLHGRLTEGQTILYKRDRLPSHLQSEVQASGAVECNWLQNCAAYSLLGSKAGPMAFTYDATTSRLLPDGDASLVGFQQQLQDSVASRLPIVAVASFDHDEHSARVALPSLAAYRWRVLVPYRLNLTARHADTHGLLRNVMDVLRAIGLNIDMVRNSMRELTEASEQGSMSFICSARMKISPENVSHRLASLKHPAVEIDTGSVKVVPVSARTIFLSIRSEFVSARPQIIDRLRDLAAEFGFLLDNAIEDRKVTTVLEDSVIERIKRADGFLQLVSEDAGWLSYERGVARGYFKGSPPIAVCYEKRAAAHMTSTKGWTVFEFRSEMNDDELVAVVRRAFNLLSLVLEGEYD